MKQGKQVPSAFSGGVSESPAAFVSASYQRTIFLGLGETNSTLSAQLGSFPAGLHIRIHRAVSFDRPITSGFTIFASNSPLTRKSILALCLARTCLNPALQQKPTTRTQRFHHFFE